MGQSGIEVLTIGNAIVDVIAQADEAFIERHAIIKGGMRLIDANEALELYSAMGPGIEMSGGSAANTAVGLAALGARSAYIGKVKSDQLGEVFAHDIRAAGVDYRTSMAEAGPATARCLILVTADAQRSMNTYLGACVELEPSDVDEELVAAAEITYLEGYLWDPPRAKEAFRKATRVAHQAGRKVALSLSDPFCVERYREEFLDFVKHEVDILFANEQEILHLHQVASFDDALQLARQQCEVIVLTRGAKGSVVAGRGEVHVIDASPVERIVDTTGAGDLFAGGFLYGLTHNRDLANSARIGSLAAAEVISHFGARPETSLRALVESHGL